MRTVITLLISATRSINRRSASTFAVYSVLPNSSVRVRSLLSSSRGSGACPTVW
jgi:hypothetical protein